MTILKALLLGILQGVTEFLPISSSGHLKLFQMLFQMGDLKEFLPFDLVCHLGTLMALLIVLRKEVKEAIFSFKYSFAIMIALTPLIPLFFALPSLKGWISQPKLLGWFFLGTSVLLFCGERYAHRAPLQKITGNRSLFQALVVGIFQAFAVFPGLSRSGATISAGRLLGWDPLKAARFSFLLSIPTILGALLADVKDLFSTPSIPLSHYLVGFFSSWIVGMIVLPCFFSLLKRRKLGVFIIYCFVVGIGTLVYTHI